VDRPVGHFIVVVHSCGGVPILGGTVGEIVAIVRVVVPLRGKVIGIVRVVVIQVDDGSAVVPGKQLIAGCIAAPL
jgi:hypothetical protein